ncbi:MAG TPA: NADH-quinone oxidoreductase subunit F, partial [candidate division Zixibacteria bacterium]|nr:NADH-quinone oxidoreductase subunit F [candidate division Zixibacteria bacterium]
MKTVKVGLGTCGISAGGEKVYKAFQEELKEHPNAFELKETGCIGMCYSEVLIEIENGSGESVLYGEVTPERVGEIVEKAILSDQTIDDWLAVKPDNKQNFLDNQTRIVLRNCGVIDPGSIDEYIAKGGYEASKKALTTMSPEEVIDDVIKSGLKGRGGGGFPTGVKWNFTRKAKGDKKYIICNADEGDPGAFMDRSVLEGDPNAVLEGMIIAGYAIGSDAAYIYCRAEYPKAIARLRQAIAQAKKKNFLGDNIFGTDFTFNIKIKEGAGAFVCGEETALIASIEGKRGMQKFRPPIPANSGLWNKPTNINNVETFANVPWIILNGGDAYAAY